MTSLRTRTGAAVPTPSVMPQRTTRQRTPEMPAIADPAARPWQERELAELAQRIHEQHPAMSLGEIRTLVDHEHAALAPSRVQGFRMILTERAVRRLLATHPGRRARI